MTCWIIIPAKAPPEAKGRLGGVLDQTERNALAAAMLDAAITAASGAEGIDGLVLVGTSQLGLAAKLDLLPEPEGGLNAALTFARAELAKRGATRIISLAGDLPLVTSADVEALIAAPPGEAAIAPDRHGTGTNALSLPLPAALAFAYGYGLGSCARHKAEAARIGLTLHEIITPGLARDVDEPADLVDAQGLLARHSI